jgi:hypothetical protein
MSVALRVHVLRPENTQSEEAQTFARIQSEIWQDKPNI